ncbi:MAG: hypothetical protein WCS01_04780 [bacterium]
MKPVSGVDSVGNLRPKGARLIRFLESLATPADRALPAFWAVLYLAGLVGWVAFFRTGATGEEFYRSVDWPKERQYFGVIKQSLQTSALPWHTSMPLQPSQPTDRFLAIPETLSLLAPQIQGLRWLSIRDFVLLNHLVMFTIGTLGWYGLSRRYRFPPLVAAIGFALFAFNGHLVAHISAGHSMWSAYYWLPFLVLLLLQSCERPPTSRQAIPMALVLGAIVLQGGCHLYIWCLFFLGAFFIVNPVRHKMIAVAAVLSVLLAAHRFAPAALAFHANVHRLQGFGSAGALGDALLSRRLYNGSIFPWEFDSYIGPAAAVFLLASLALPVLVPACQRALFRYWPLVLPVAALTALSFRSAPYFVLNYLPIPLLGTQRVPSRLVLLPLVFLITMSCIGATNLLTNCRRGWRTLAGAAGLVVGAGVLLALFRHGVQWRLASMEATPAFRLVVGEKPIPTLVCRSDPAYVAAVWSGLAVSILALLAMAWWWRGNRSPDKEVRSQESI